MIDTWYFFELGCLILSNCFTIFEHLNYTEKAEPVQESIRILEGFIWIQRTNSTYDSVDFGDPVCIITYFKKLFQALTVQYEGGSDIERVINIILVQIIDRGIKDGVKALSIMKSTAVKIHGAFQELDWDDDNSTANTADAKIERIWKVGTIVTIALNEALVRLNSLADFGSDPK